MREEAVLFGKGGSLVGVVTDPETSEGRGDHVAVILLNSGFLHHVGPGAIYVKIARLMARQGFTSLRFDFSGIGDSGVRMDSVPFERSSILEAQEAMDYLEATRGVRQFILMGICSGAVASFETADADERVVGAVLMNPRSFGEKPGSTYGSRARMRYYGRVGASNRRSWVKVLKGQVGFRKILNTVFQQLRTLAPQRGRASQDGGDMGERLLALNSRLKGMVVVCSEWDWSLDYLNAALGERVEELNVKYIAHSDHTFTLLWSQEYLFEILTEWATSFTGEPSLMGSSPAKI